MFVSLMTTDPGLVFPFLFAKYIHSFENYLFVHYVTTGVYRYRQIILVKLSKGLGKTNFLRLMCAQNFGKSCYVFIDHVDTTVSMYDKL